MLPTRNGALGDEVDGGARDDLARFEVATTRELGVGREANVAGDLECRADRQVDVAGHDACACEPNRPKRGQVPVRIGVGGEGAVEKHLGALGDGDVAAAVERAVAVDECAGRSNRRRAARPE